MENFIQLRRKSRGLSQKDVADALRVTVAQVSKWEGGKVDIPTSRIVALADLLRCSVGDLIGYAGFDLTSETGPIVYQMPEATSIGAVADIPVYGATIAMARETEDDPVEQAVMHRNKVLHHARRTVALTGCMQVYGLYVAGSAMEPRFMDGEMVLADPDGRIRGGDDVVVHLRPEHGSEGDSKSPTILLKRLVRRTSSYVDLAQHLPEKVFRIDAVDILAIDRVIPLSEILQYPH